MKRIVLFLLLAVTQVSFGQWKPADKSFGGLVVSMDGLDNSIFAGVYGKGLFLSTDSGVNWTAKNTGLTDLMVQTVNAGRTSFFVGTDQGVFVSANNGDTWTAKNTGLKNLSVQAFSYSGSSIYLGTIGEGLYLSNDNGNNWTNKNTGLNIIDVQTICAIGNSVFVGTDDGTTGGIFLSTNRGSSWSAKTNGLKNLHVQRIATNSTTLFAGTNGGVFLSTDNGDSWTASGVPAIFVNAIAVSGNTIFAGTSDGILLSTNNGVSWVPQNTGLTDLFVLSIIINNGTVLVGTGGGQIYHADLTEITTGVEEKTGNLSELQISPQPASEYISVNNIKNGMNSLTDGCVCIFNLLGEKVRTQLANNSHFLQINISDFTNGIYYLKSGNETKMFVKQ